MYKLIWIAAVFAALAAGQTQVDLQQQAKSIDFSAASSTKPIALGTVLPATCGVGQMFFLSSAPAGQNVYGCTASNTWTLQSGGGGGGGGSVDVENAGALIGSNSTLDFTGGTGILYAISTAGSNILIQTSANTAVTPTLASQQAGGVSLCASSSGSTTAYTCSLAPTLTVYTPGMLLNWEPDVTAQGGPATLNVDFLGATSVKLSDGLTDPAPGEIVAGRMRQIWFDGSTFRLLGQVVPAGVLGDALPACGTTVRGRFWFVAGASGVQDHLYSCVRNSSSVYAWITLY